MESKCVVCCEVHEISTNKTQSKSAEEKLTIKYFLENFLNYRVLPDDLEGVPSEFKEGDSISFCKKCYRWVSQGRKLWLQLAKLEERLNNLRTQVEYRLWDTYFTEKKRQQAEAQEYNECISLRDSVRQNIYQKCTDKGFEEPDSPSIEDDHRSSPTQIKIEALEIIPDVHKLPDNVTNDIDHFEAFGETQTNERTSRRKVKEEFEKIGNQDVLEPDLNASDNNQSEERSDDTDYSDHDFDFELIPDNHCSSSSSDSNYSEDGSHSDSESDYDNNESSSRKNVITKEDKHQGEKPSKVKKPRKNAKSLDSRTCPVCHKVLSRPSQMLAHLQAKHEKKFSFFCDICSKGFSRKDTMKDHKLTHMNEEERSKFFATTTSKRYVRMLNQTPRSMQQFACVADKTCPECNKIFVTPSAMKNHLNSRHERKIMFHCDVCQRGFFRKDSLRIHERTHLTAEEKDALTLAKKINEVGEIIQNGQSGEEQSKSLGKYSEKIVNQVLARTCPVCKKIFDKPSRMQTHLEGVHTNRQTHICEVCGKSFAWRDTLVRHLKWHETGVKNRPFQCPEEGCGKAFATRRDLRVHSNTHTGKKDYLCQLCGAAFSQRFSYDRHLLYKHTENAEKKHKCTICDKRFLTKSLLAQHLKSKTHGGPGFKSRTSNSSSVDLNNSKTKSDCSKDSSAIVDRTSRKTKIPSGEQKQMKIHQTSGYCDSTNNLTPPPTNYEALNTDNNNEASELSLPNNNGVVQTSNHNTIASPGSVRTVVGSTTTTISTAVPNQYTMMFNPYY